jgi:hypothetical protein
LQADAAAGTGDECGQSGQVTCVSHHVL